MLAPPLIAFGFSSSVHTQHHHAIYRLDARVVHRRVDVALATSYHSSSDSPRGTIFHRGLSSPNFPSISPAFSNDATPFLPFFREKESGSKWKRTTFRRMKNGSYASYFVLSRAVRRLIRPVHYFPILRELMAKRGGKRERERWRGREKDSPSDHARLNFRVGGNGSRGGGV